MIVPATPKADEISSMFAPACGDLFAGAGGWSCGAEAAFCAGGDRDRRMDLAVNHWSTAIMCHSANHPLTEHRQASVWDVDPAEVLPGRELRYLHASPDCTHFSKARGSKPVKKEIRGLAWVVRDWAKARRPHVITLENVEEFKTWGPIGDDGQPEPARRGETFAEWVAAIEGLGYVVEWRVLKAHHYGAPTTRKRLYIIARRDGKPIVWPEPTHGPGLLPYRTAADCIDWTEPMCSIFATPTEAKAWATEHGRHRPKRPLAEKTLARIARGVMKYVVEAADPFILQVQNGSSTNGTHGVGVPFPTVTANPKGGGHALVSPSLVQVGYGERKGQAPRSLDLGKPLGTVVGGGSKHALVAAFLAKHYTGVVGQAAGKPIGTVTAVDHHSVVAANLTHFYTSNTCGGQGDPRQPSKTVTGGGQHSALVAALLQTYYGTSTEGVDIAEPCPTVTGNDRIGVVTVQIDGTTYAVTDIAMRMLTPRELANAQGFPHDYVFDVDGDGRPLSKRDQVKLIGNSVCPAVAEAIVRENIVNQGVLDQ